MTRISCGHRDEEGKKRKIINTGKYAAKRKHPSEGEILRVYLFNSYLLHNFTHHPEICK